MAFSNNLQQAKNWGKFILGEDVEDPRSPGWALEYWIAANQRALDVGRAMGRRFLPVFYERLCGDPRHEISRIFEFLDLDQDPENFLGLIKPPKSIGRHAENDMSHFSERQISLVEEIIGGSLGTQTIG